jgi:hypothetical protein
MFDPNQISLRHRCRNPGCRIKLPAPVGDARQAFCCQPCHASFYRTRCVVCERDISVDPMTGERRSGSAHRRYCGRKCKAAAQFLSPPVGGYGGNPGDFKKPFKIKGENAPQTRPSLPPKSSGAGIAGPPQVIATEVFAGRNWRKVVSPDGVETEVSILRHRALREGGAS